MIQSDTLLDSTLTITTRIKTELIQAKGETRWLDYTEALQTVLNEFKNEFKELNEAALNISLTKINELVLEPLLNRLISMAERSVPLSSVREDMELDLLKIHQVSTQNLLKIALELPKVARSPRDIFSLEKNSEEWVLLDAFVKWFDIEDHKKLENIYTGFKHLISVGSVFHSMGQCQQTNILIRPIKQSLGGLYYLLHKEAARKHTIKNICNPTLEFTTGIWGIMEKNFFIKSFVKSVVPYIKTNQKLYLPRMFDEIRLEDINQSISDGTIFTTIQQDQQNPKLKMNSQSLLQNLTGRLTTKDRINRVKVRILSSRNNILKQTPDHEGALQQYLRLNAESSITAAPKPQNSSKKTNILLHIHGGGWVSMSSFSHQMYTRKWANQLGDDYITVSVDYRLAPKFKYPYSLDDCWQVYAWILFFSEFYLNINLGKIVIAGDSAGGNMGLGICFRAQQLGVPQPEGIFLPYPAMNLNLQSFTPSTLYALNDTISPFTILKQVIEAYLPEEGQPDKDPFLSPCVAADNFLANLPDKLHIICGSLDPLRDEGIKFLHRVLNAKGIKEPAKYPRMYIFNGLVHGFQNCDVKFVGIGPVAEVNDASLKIIQDFFS